LLSLFVSIASFERVLLLLLLLLVSCCISWKQIKCTMMFLHILCSFIGEENGYIEHEASKMLGQSSFNIKRSYFVFYVFFVFEVFVFEESVFEVLISCGVFVFEVFVS